MTDFVYVMLLVLCGIGFVLWEKYRPAEVGGRATVFFTFRVLVKRLFSGKEVWNLLGNRVRVQWNRVENRRINQEIYDSSLLLKNLAVSEKDNVFSADYIFELLMENSKKIRPIYSEMISLYRQGKDEIAFETFAKETGSRYGKNFSFILSRLDKMKPVDLREQIEVFQELIGQQRVTENMKKVQNTSIITTAASSVVFFIMMIDFAVVIMFMNTLDMMNNIF